MNNRILVLLLACLSALTSFADKRMGADKAINVMLTEPDDFGLTGYSDTARIDSVRYFVEHARWKESWAYEALAEIYRYGKHGVDKSLFNAIMCYEEAGMSVAKIAEAAYDSDHYDELGLINHLMEGMDKKHLTDADIISEIESMPYPAPEWASFLLEILRHDPDCRKDFIEPRLTAETTPDELLIGFACLAMTESDSFEKRIVGTGENYMENVRAYGEKLPMLYNVAATRIWRKYCQEDDNNEHIANALECMCRADRAGFLSTINMRRILDYCEQHGKDNNLLFSEEELVRFEKICQRGYGDNTDSQVVIEEVVEIEECPVESIEE